MKGIALEIAYGVTRLLLGFLFAALITAAVVLLWRDVRFVAHTVNVWADHVSR